MASNRYQRGNQSDYETGPTANDPFKGRRAVFVSRRNFLLFCCPAIELNGEKWIHKKKESWRQLKHCKKESRFLFGADFFFFFFFFYSAVLNDLFMESNFESRNELVKIGEPKPNLVDWFVFFFQTYKSILEALRLIDPFHRFDCGISRRGKGNRRPPGYGPSIDRINS